MEDESIFEDDYYAFFNISKNASTDDIRNAFKLLSKRFHPDKHSDPALKSYADVIFSRMKKIYDVLMDPKKRVIYDTLGVRGLECEAGALIEKKYMSSQQIKEEYEQLVKDREARALEQRCNPRGTITMLVDATNLFEKSDSDISEDDEDTYLETLRLMPSIEVRSMSIHQSVAAPISIKNNISLHGNLSVRNGNGNGQMSCIWRHIYSPLTWGEVELGAGNGPLGSLKICRTFRKNISAQFQIYGVLTPFGITPGMSVLLNRQFNKNFFAYMSYSEGTDETSMTTAGIYENEWCIVNTGITLGIKQSMISTSYTHKFLGQRDFRIKVGAKLGTLGALFEYGGEGKISSNNTLGMSMSVGTHTGVTMVIKLVRNTQTLMLPVVLADQILPTSIIFGTIVPLGFFWFAKKMIFDPILEAQRNEVNKQKKESNFYALDERRKEARNYQELMKETYRKIVQEQDDKSGIVISRAIYGAASLINDYAKDFEKNISHDSDVIDVTIAVQVMFNEQLQVIRISDRSKSYLPGFCDCSFGNEKKLLIVYKYKEQNYLVKLNDTQAAILPSKAHLV